MHESPSRKLVRNPPPATTQDIIPRSVNTQQQIFEVDLKTDSRFCSKTKKQYKKVTELIQDQELQFVLNLVNKDKASYTGYVDHNQEPAGWGILVWTDGSKYEGEFKDGLPNGRGKVVLENEDSYEGQWKDDQAHGFGQFITQSKVYTGEWLHDLYHGKGEEKFKDGSCFTGAFVEGKK